MPAMWWTHHHPSNARDVMRRRLITTRNRLWIAWLRLPLRWAWNETRQIMREARAAGIAAPVLGAALRGLPWAMARRDPVPPEVLRRWLEVYRPHAVKTVAGTTIQLAHRWKRE
jgi:hypothetical protein